MKLAISVCALRVGVTIVKVGICAIVLAPVMHVIITPCRCNQNCKRKLSETAISVCARRVVGVTIVKAGSCAFVLVCHATPCRRNQNRK